VSWMTSFGLPGSWRGCLGSNSVIFLKKSFKVPQDRDITRGLSVDAPTSTPRRPALKVPSRIHGQDPKSWTIAIKLAVRLHFRYPSSDELAKVPLTPADPPFGGCWCRGITWTGFPLNHVYSTW